MRPCCWYSPIPNLLTTEKTTWGNSSPLIPTPGRVATPPAQPAVGAQRPRRRRSWGVCCAPDPWSTCTPAACWPLRPMAPAARLLVFPAPQPPRAARAPAAAPTHGPGASPLRAAAALVGLRAAATLAGQRTTAASPAYALPLPSPASAPQLPLALVALCASCGSCSRTKKLDRWGGRVIDRVGLLAGGARLVGCRISFYT